MVWEETELKNLITRLVDYRGKTPTKTDEGIKLVTAKVIKGGRILEDGEHEYIAEEDFDETMRRGVPKINDIIITTEAPLGEVAMIKNDEKIALAQRVILFSPDPEKVVPQFLFYSFFTKLVQHRLEAKATGTTVLGISNPSLQSIEIPTPPLPAQRRIAQVLGRYDSLIENYGAQIRTLEAVAQNLYREWFVRHRINGCELPIDGKTKLPVGWEEKELGEIAADKRRIVKAKDLEADMPYVGLEHLSIKSIIIKDCGVAEDVDSDKLSFEKNDILFGKIRPYLHKVCLSHFTGVCSSDTIVIKPIIENALGFVMLTVFDEKFVEFADKISNGTKMPRAEWSVLKTYKIAVPPENILKAFEKIVAPMFAKMENLQTQITNLREMRDKLLPRLLSGKIEVKV